MSRNKLEMIIEWMLPVLVVIIVGAMFTEIYDSKYVIYFSIFFSIIVMILQIFIIVRKYKKYKQNNDILLLEEWIEYKKKREEIEEKIESLTRELISSDTSVYLDVNRLVFDGQNKLSNTEQVGYKLSQQFGLSDIDTSIRKDTAVFLTPFNKGGIKVYEICRDALDKVGIYVRMTDTHVEKSDILANIIILIIQSEFVIVNIDGRNPNVYYELGIAHALGKQTIILSNVRNLIEDIGFDIRQKRIIMYHSDDDLKEQLMYMISNMKYHQD